MGLYLFINIGKPSYILNGHVHLGKTMFFSGWTTKRGGGGTIRAESHASKYPGCLQNVALQHHFDILQRHFDTLQRHIDIL